MGEPGTPLLLSSYEAMKKEEEERRKKKKGRRRRKDFLLCFCLCFSSFFFFFFFFFFCHLALAQVQDAFGCRTQACSGALSLNNKQTKQSNHTSKTHTFTRDNTAQPHHPTFPLPPSNESKKGKSALVLPTTLVACCVFIPVVTPTPDFLPHTC